MAAVTASWLVSSDVSSWPAKWGKVREKDHSKMSENLLCVTVTLDNTKAKGDMIEFHTIKSITTIHLQG